MMGLLRLTIAMALGALIAASLPQAGVVASTQEIIAFLSLLMAGLLPAMILTATILRGGALSPRAVDEYGGALRIQLRFWAFLFASAALACLAVVGIKIFSTPNVSFRANFYFFVLNQNSFTYFSILTGGGCMGAVVQRLLPAYHGLISLLALNVRIAKIDSVDRSLNVAQVSRNQNDNGLVKDPYEHFH